MEEAEAKGANVKSREMIDKIMKEESSVVIHPYSTTSRASPIVAKVRIPNTYTDMRRYIPGIQRPLKDSDLVYGQIYIGTGAEYTNWGSIF